VPQLYLFNYNPVSAIASCHITSIHWPIYSHQTKQQQGAYLPGFGLTNSK